MTGVRSYFATLMLLSVVSACAIQPSEVGSALKTLADMKKPGKPCRLLVRRMSL